MAQTLEERPCTRKYEPVLSEAAPERALPIYPQSVPRLKTASRPWRMDWAEVGMLLLLLACAALAIYRLAWAMQA